MISKLLVAAGAGTYPRLVIEGARRAGVPRVDVLAIKGSTDRATMRAADNVHAVRLGEIAQAVRWVGEERYDGVVMAGQINPLSLFRGGFDAEIRAVLASLPVKNAHTVYGRLVEMFERVGGRVLPASSYMEDSLPGIGALTKRGFTDEEASDIRRGVQVAVDVGRHDVGQTVLVKSGMVLAVEAFEGTNAAIRRAGRLGKGSVLFKAAREGHDMRFDIPVVGLKTLKMMRRARVTALGFQAGRLILLDRDEVINFANHHDIAIVGVDSGLPHAPTRPEEGTDPC